MVYDDSATGGGRLSEKQFFDNAVAYNNGSGTPTERLVYTYDAFGRIVRQQHIRPTVTDPYTTVYDVQGRVTQETTPTGFINYEYDLLGRKTKTPAPRHDILHFCVRELGASSRTYPVLGFEEASSRDRYFDG
jgi:YD repeat-containing protein